jgi:hypothetical protein
MAEENRPQLEDKEKEVPVGGLKGAAPPPSFPEGGTRAWLVVVGCFCIMFYTFGYLNAFG